MESSDNFIADSGEGDAKPVMNEAMLKAAGIAVP